jgi:hypothetical protein
VLYNDKGEPGKAVPLYQQAVAHCRRLLGNTHPNTLRAIQNLGEATCATGSAGLQVGTHPKLIQNSAGVKSTLIQLDNSTERVFELYICLAIGSNARPGRRVLHYCTRRRRGTNKSSEQLIRTR